MNFRVSPSIIETEIPVITSRGFGKCTISGVELINDFCLVGDEFADLLILTVIKHISVKHPMIRIFN
jgi:hypothetical protein